MAKLNELSRQAEQTTEAMHSAQLDLDNKLDAQQHAEAKHTDDQAVYGTAQAQLATFQSSVDKFAAAMYMGGRTDGMDAMLTADSPQSLIDQLAVQRVMATEMSVQMNNYRSVNAAGRQGAGSLRQISSRRQDRRRAGCRGARRPAIQAKPAAGADRRRQVAVPGPHARPAGGACGAAAGPPPPPAARRARGPGGDCAPPGGIPPGDVAPPDGAIAPDLGTGEGTIVVQAALTSIGSPYTWGGAGPNQFDCSGLVMWAFQQAGISLPHSSQALAQGGQAVDMSQMQPGDVVTYYSDASTPGSTSATA